MSDAVDLIFVSLLVRNQIAARKDGRKWSMVAGIGHLLKQDNVWNKAREKRTSCRDVLSPDRSVNASMVARTRSNRIHVSQKDVNGNLHDTYKHRRRRDAPLIQDYPARIDANRLAKRDPMHNEKHGIIVVFFLHSFTKTEKETNKSVVSASQMVSLGGKRKIKSSDWPRIWLILELAVSPTPRTLRTFRRLCRSPQLLFLESLRKGGKRQKRRKEIERMWRNDHLPARYLHVCSMRTTMVNKSLVEWLVLACVFRVTSWREPKRKCLFCYVCRDKPRRAKQIQL